MTRSRDGERAMTPEDGSAETPADPSVGLARLRWRLAAYRRSAIQRVEDCIAGVAALRRQLNDHALDAVLDGFRSVRADLRAMDSAGPIRPADLQALLDRLAALQADMARFAAARPGAEAAAGSPPSSGSASARS
jgi:hypothetical protein